MGNKRLKAVTSVGMVQCIAGMHGGMLGVVWRRVGEWCYTLAHGSGCRPFLALRTMIPLPHVVNQALQPMAPGNLQQQAEG